MKSEQDNDYDYYFCHDCGMMIDPADIGFDDILNINYCPHCNSNDVEFYDWDGVS